MQRQLELSTFEGPRKMTLSIWDSVSLCSSKVFLQHDNSLNCLTILLLGLNTWNITWRRDIKISFIYRVLILFDKSVYSLSPTAISQLSAWVVGWVACVSTVNKKAGQATNSSVDKWWFCNWHLRMVSHV